MARRSETRTIDGIEFTVTQMPAMRSQRVFQRLASAIGPAIAAALRDAPAGDAILEGDVRIGDAVKQLFDRLTIPELEAIEKELLETATVVQDGQTARVLAIADELLAGRLSTLFKLVAFAIEVNYRDFFDAAGGARALLAEALTWKSRGASPKTGPAGA